MRAAAAFGDEQLGRAVSRAIEAPFGGNVTNAFGGIELRRNAPRPHAGGRNGGARRRSLARRRCCRSVRVRFPRALGTFRKRNPGGGGVPVSSLAAIRSTSVVSAGAGNVASRASALVIAAGAPFVASQTFGGNAGSDPSPSSARTRSGRASRARGAVLRSGQSERTFALRPSLRGRGSPKTTGSRTHAASGRAFSRCTRAPFSRASTGRSSIRGRSNRCVRIGRSGTRTPGAAAVLYRRYRPRSRARRETVRPASCEARDRTAP